MTISQHIHAWFGKTFLKYTGLSDKFAGTWTKINFVKRLGEAV